MLQITSKLPVSDAGDPSPTRTNGDLGNEARDTKLLLHRKHACEKISARFGLARLYN